MNEEEKRYDAHFLLGDYYTWSAATAGNDDAPDPEGVTNPAAQVNSETSICPKGWKLPNSGRNLNTKLPFEIDDSFYKLLLAYGYPQANDYTPPSNAATTAGSYTALLDGELNGSSQNVTKEPLYLVRSGVMFVTVNNSYLAHLGHSGTYWTSTVRPTAANQAFGLSFNDKTISPVNDFDKNMYPMSVRCLAR